MNEETIWYEINRCKYLIERYEARLGSLSKHGYQAYGYYLGKLSVLEDMLDSVQDVEV